MAWLTASGVHGSLLVFAAVLGLAYGVRIALMPVVLIEIFGLQNIGAVLGVFFTATGFSAVIGPPLTSLIVDCTGSYRWAAAFALAMGLLGFAAVLRLKADRVSTINSVLITQTILKNSVVAQSHRDGPTPVFMGRAPA